MKIRYNPYLKTIRYWWLNDDGVWEPLAEDSRLSKSKYQQGTLQHQAAEILEIIREDYCQSVGLELVFEGTENDWADVRRIAEQYDPDHRLQLCEQITCGLTPAPAALNKIESIFSQLSANFASHEDDRVREVLDNYTQTMRPEIPICIMGTYSAGKSTFINALIGEEILPSDMDPSTAKIFRITPLANGDYLNTKIRFQYGGTDTEITFNEKGYSFRNLNQLPDSELKKHLETALSGKEMSPAYIYQTLSVLNDFDKDADSSQQNKQKPAVSNLIEVETPFVRSTLPLDRFQFVIYDTPGSNSESHKDHTEVLKTALKEQTDGLPIVLTTPTTMDSKDAGVLLELVKDMGGALDSSNILAVVGHADTLSLGNAKKIKDSHTVIKTIAPERVLLVSSIIGLGAKKEDMQQCVYDNDKEVFEDKERRFRTGERRLYEYNDLTEVRLDTVRAAGGESNDGLDDRAKLLHNSGLWAVENEIALFAEKYAIYNKCQQAQEYLQEAISLTESATRQKKKEQKDKLDKVDSSLTEKKKALLNKLKSTEKEKLKASFTAYEELNKKLLTVYALQTYVSKTDTKNAWDRAKAKGKHYLGGSVAAMQKWVNEKVHATWDRWWQEAKKETESFWTEEINTYKTACIEIVKESDALTDEEKAFMEQFILARPGLRSPEKGPNVLSLMEEKWFFFLWPREEQKTLNIKKCTTKMNEAISKAIEVSTQSYGSAIHLEVDRWANEFQSGLTEKLADFNSDLHRLTENLRLCCARLEQLEANQKLLEGSAQEIKDLFKFKGEWEKQ